MTTYKLTDLDERVAKSVAAGTKEERDGFIRHRTWLAKLETCRKKWNGVEYIYEDDTDASPCNQRNAAHHMAIVARVKQLALGTSDYTPKQRSYFDR